METETNKLKVFYQKNKNTVLAGGALVLLYVVLKLAKRGYTLTKDTWTELVARGGVTNPLKGRLVLTSGYGYRTNPATGQSGQFHNGADLVLRGGATSGAPVLAPFSGTITVNEWNVYGGGNQLIIDSGYATFGFAHLLERSPLRVGTIVKKGQVVGRVGNTGTSTGAHLHFTLRLGGAFANPVTAMPGLAAALK